MEDLNKLYSPSAWTTRYPANEIVTIHGQVGEKYSNAARENVLHETIRYSNGEETVLQVFYSDADSFKCNSDKAIDSLDFIENIKKGKPVFVYLHGGYWQWGSVYWSGFMAELFTKHGITVIALGYDIAPKCSFDNIVKQVELATACILKQAHKSGSQVFMCGHSAGAHLAAMMLNVDFSATYDVPTEQQFNLVLASGVFDLRPLVQTDINDNLKLDLNTATHYSPLLLNNVSVPLSLRSNINVLVAYGQNESPAFKQQSEDFARHLVDKLKIPNVTVKHIQNVDHFDIVENLSDKEFTLSKDIIRMILNH